MEEDKLNFLRKLAFYDFGRGFYKSVINEFETNEINYGDTCFKTYLAMLFEITLENLNIDQIKKFHQMIVLNVENTNYGDEQIKANQFVEFMRFGTVDESVSQLFVNEILQRHPYIRIDMVDDSFCMAFFRINMFPEEIERTIISYIITFKTNMQVACSLQNQSQKEELIFNLCQDLVFLHPFEDANCRFFCIALHNTLRKAAGLSEIIVCDPNLFAKLRFTQFKQIKGAYFEIDQLFNYDDEILNQMNVQAIQAYIDMHSDPLTKILFSNYCESLKGLFNFLKQYNCELLETLIINSFTHSNLLTVVMHCHKDIIETFLQEVNDDRISKKAKLAIVESQDLYLLDISLGESARKGYQDASFLILNFAASLSDKYKAEIIEARKCLSIYFKIKEKLESNAFEVSHFLGSRYHIYLKDEKKEVPYYIAKVWQAITDENGGFRCEENFSNSWDSIQKLLDEGRNPKDIFTRVNALFFEYTSTHNFYKDCIETPCN
ncbi:hypothetical protein L3V86_09490 [Thiotrichales bacterium 19S11-10]|nr:hypothetical protein [Thiotrichales bacterium 19S11-10]